MKSFVKHFVSDLNPTFFDFITTINSDLYPVSRNTTKTTFNNN